MIIFVNETVVFTARFYQHRYCHLPEGILQLSFHGLDIRILYEELGAQLAELGKLNLAGAILIDLLEDLHQLLLAGSEAHGPQNLVEVVRREELLFLRVEQVKAGFQTLDLVVLEPSGLVDLLEIDSGVGVGLARHAACAGGGASTWQGSEYCCSEVQYSIQKDKPTEL